MSATFGPVAEQHVNTSRRKLEEILVKVAMRILMQMKMKMKMMKLFSGENKKEVGGDPSQGGDERTLIQMKMKMKMMKMNLF